ncbi:MAG: DUF6240 domain-containing protein [Lachnospiraceae bacterium]|nr:DUF6240 domain-containing protein [Lachnospiraceae bacterium]
MNINIPKQGRDLLNDNMISIGSHDNVSRTTKVASEYSVDISGKDKDISGFGMEELKSFNDVKSKASVKDVSLEHNALAVMSNSMSGEDFANITKDGFSVSDLEPGETVTILDKIKTTLAKSGVEIPGYTDDLSTEQIAKITGSTGYAIAIESSLNDNMLPVTRENVESIDDALKLSERVDEPSSDAKKFIINNDLDLTVTNFYMANHSSSDSNSGGKAGFYKDATGYVGKNPTSLDFEQLKPQIEKIISDADLEVNEKTLTDAKWLLEKDLPLTKENLQKLSDINSISFPLNEKRVADASAAALADGINVKDAILTNTESIQVKAGKFIENVEGIVANTLNDLSNGKTSEAYNITHTDNEISARRVLEETRLALTIEASVSLIKKGINVDTKDLQKLVEDLKQAEKESFAPFLMEEDYEDVPADKLKAYDDELTLKIDLFKKTTGAVNEIKSAPIDVIGEAVTAGEGKNVTLGEIADSSVKIKSDYEKAGRSYETMMTAPRADMGDSIKKAFRNVDDILEDLDVEVTRLNEKAVRTLGYAGIEINESNIDKAVNATVAVENVIAHMTPAKTLSMIRNGENPLDTDIYELSDKLLSESEDEVNTKYSEFLYKLEKSGSITESEKSAFIGMYRLFRKIEKSDGKLVGDVIKADEKLTLSNLLTSSRSDRQVGTDVKIDDDFGFLEKLITSGESITDQILRGFSNKDIDKEYAKEEAKHIKEMITEEETVIRALENMDEPQSPSNLAAMNMIINSRGSFFKGIKDKLDEDGKAELESEIENLQESFEDEESVKDAYESFAKRSEEILKNQAQTADNYIDVRSYKLLNKQLNVISKLADSRTYEVPVEIDGELTSINLKIVSDSENAGRVKATFETEGTGRVSAEFVLKNGIVTGFIATENSYFESVLREKEEGFKAEFEQVGVTVSSMDYASSRGLNIKGNYVERVNLNTPPTKQLYRLAKAIIKSVQK